MKRRARGLVVSAILALAPSLAVAAGPRLRLLSAYDVGLDAEERDLAREVWKQTFQFIAHAPSCARLPAALTVVFARADGPATREAFGEAIRGDSNETRDDAGDDLLYVAWDRVLERRDSPLLATFELVCNTLYRLNLAPEHASADVAAETIRGWTGSLLGLVELSRSELFAHLPAATRSEIRGHSTAYKQVSYDMYGSSDFGDRACAEALIATVFGLDE